MQLPFEQSVEMIFQYVCSTCWGQLIATPAPGHDLDVHCANPDCTGDGFITRNYAEKARAISSAEYVEARIALGPLFGLEPRSAKEIMKDLGF